RRGSSRDVDLECGRIDRRPIAPGTPGLVVLEVRPRITQTHAHQRLHRDTRWRVVPRTTGRGIDRARGRLVGFPLQLDGVGRSESQLDYALDEGRIRRERPSEAAALLPADDLPGAVCPAADPDAEILVDPGLRCPQIRIAGKNGVRVEARRKAQAQ